MGVATKSKKRRPKEEELLTDQINNLPNGVLSDIVSFCWRHLWHSVLLNLEVYDGPPVHGIHAASEVSSILSLHPRPAHHFSICYSHYHSIFTTNLGG
jgi:hypothetical protein